MATWILIAGASAAVTLLVVRRIVNSNKMMCLSKVMLTGKTVIITGANCGIGKAAARELAKRHARVILACRDVDRGAEAASEIRKLTNNGELVVKRLDLASLRSVRAFCEEFRREEDRLDILINNAGIFQCPYSKTEDGFEMQMGVNHLGHFLLTNLLLDMLKSSHGRIVVVASSLLKYGSINFSDLFAEKHYDRKKAYADSKLANAHFCRHLSKNLEGTGVNVYCVHPGMVLTNLGRHLMPVGIKLVLTPLAWLFGIKTPTEGCQTVVYCSIAEELSNSTGKYYGNCKEDPWPKVACDDSVAKKLWEVSEKLTNKSV
ncbi:retinol dehydrogenase 14-like [Gigantopelta aegis]|uniref:retinol dehydrogenase 14-like n=1 Tax=Gigantopelta aegis TaxID=1735272 RepID=UPI001B88DBBD|nr:retinol dehydrogenase 14-like [Gigantopelta aegis]